VILCGLLLCQAGVPAAGAEVNSPEVNALILKGYRLMRTAKYGLAAEKLTEALILDPGNRTARVEMARLASILSADRAGPDGRFSMSPDERTDIVNLAYTTLRKTSPNIIEKMILEAVNHEKKGDLLFATRTYLQILSLRGLDLERKYSVEKRLRDVSARSNSKIDRLPENIRGLYREAYTLLSVGDFEESIKIWSEYHKKSPADAEVKRLLSLPESETVLKQSQLLKQAREYLNEQNTEKAKEIFQAVLTVSPDNQAANKPFPNLFRKPGNLSARGKSQRLWTCSSHRSRRLRISRKWSN
jgi:tetratricopeptide (TPR) repeat protein